MRKTISVRWNSIGRSDLLNKHCRSALTLPEARAFVNSLSGFLDFR